MLLNGNKIRIARYSMNMLEDEMVLFNEEANKVVVLNRTAAFIFNELVESDEFGVALTSSIIANKLLSKYNLLDSEFKKVCIDVDSSLDSLYKAELLMPANDIRGKTVK